MNIANCKKFLLIWIAAFSAPGYRCDALEESLSLLFAMAVGKTLMTARQSPVEVISTKVLYLEDDDAFPLPSTQCIYTGIERKQMCFGNNRPTRIRLQPDKSLKLGLSPQSISQLKYNASFPPPIPEPLPGQVIFPGVDPEASSIVTTLQQGAGQQREITETARQNRWLWLLRSCRKHMDGVANEYTEKEENEMIEWWMLEEVLYEADDSNEAKIRYEDLIHEEMPLKPDTGYCITPPFHNKTGTSSDVPCDGESDNENGKNQSTRHDSSDSEDDTASDEKNDSNSEEAVRSVAGPDCIITNVEPGFEVAPEIAAYCDALEWTAFKQETESDDEMPICPEIIVTAEAHSTSDDLASPSPKKKRKLSGHLKTHIEAIHDGKEEHVCDWARADGQPCHQAFGWKNYLKRHIKTVHEGKKEHVCNRTGADGHPCNKAFVLKGDLKRHTKTVHEGKKEHICDWTGADGHPCNKAFGLKGDLKRHTKTVHEGKKEHICDWTGADGQPCHQAFAQKRDLKIHTKTVHEGKKEYICDWTGADGQPCHQAFGLKSNLKMHIKIVHESKKEHVCDWTGVDGQPCHQAFGLKIDLRRHIETIHEGKKEYVCDWTGADGQPCHQAFGLKRNLKRHIKTVHESKKEHVCDWAGADGQPCHQEFGLKRNLKTHIKTVHEGKKEHVCDRSGVDGQPCNRAFVLKKDLEKHMDTVHEGKKRNRKRPRIEEPNDQTADSL